MKALSHRRACIAKGMVGLAALWMGLWGCGGSSGPDTAALMVKTTPEEGALVTIGGVTYGETPARVTGLRAGNTYVEVTREGYKRKYEQVAVPESGEVELTIAMEALSGYLTLESEPSGAEVHLDANESLGKTPFRNIAVPVGDHTYELVAENYLPLKVDLKVEEDFRYSFTHVLEPMEAKLQVFSRPSGAVIHLNENIQIDKTPASFSLVPGTYTVSVYAKGFIAGEQVIQLAANGDESMELILEAGEVPPGMVLVPAGEFIFGVNEEAPDERPEKKAVLDAFYMDKFEVTNEQFRAVFPSHTFPAGAETMPVAGVTWHQATEYAVQVGKRLPTEMEWEKAARGPDGLKYPWGGAFNPEWCSAKEGSGRSKIERIGTYREGVSPYGCLDMAGNVMEWVNTVYGPYPGNKEVPDIYGQVYRVLRGGSYLSPAFDVRGAKRHFDKPETARGDYGFRCALDISDDPPP